MVRMLTVLGAVSLAARKDLLEHNVHVYQQSPNLSPSLISIFNVFTTPIHPDRTRLHQYNETLGRFLLLGAFDGTQPSVMIDVSCPHDDSST